MKAKLSVLMPAFNESRHIYRNIGETVAALEELGNEYRIIVIDDCSRDDTVKEIERAAKEYDQVLIRENEENHGKGWALKSGFKAAEGDLAVFLDADLDIHPRQIKGFLEIMEREDADVVIGSKRHERSVLDYPLQRRVISTFYFYIVKALFGLPVRDTQTGLKIFKVEALENALPRILVKRYAFDLELLVNVHHLGYKIVEAPVELTFQRRLGRIGLKDLYYTGLDTLAVFYRLKILKFYDRDFERLRERPKVSIIVPTRGPNAYLLECIASCRRIDYPDYEILILPDECFDVDDPRVRIVPTGDVGPSRKRDLGAEEARGELLAFLDDDAYPTVDWLSNAVANFSSSDVAAVGGPTVTPPRDDFMQQAGGAVYLSSIVVGNYAYRYTPRTHRDVEDYPSSNLIVRKSVMEEVGGFGNTFWPGEDTVFCLKIVRDLKKRIVYDPDVMVYHHRRRLFRPHLAQVKSYALHRGYFVKRFPETSLKWAYFAPSLLILGTAVGWLPSLFYGPWLNLYLVGVGGYLVCALLSALAKLNLKVIPVVFVGILATHFAYGFWFLKGLVSRRLKEE